MPGIAGSPSQKCGGVKRVDSHLESHCLLSEKWNNEKVLYDLVPDESKSSGMAKSKAWLDSAHSQMYFTWPRLFFLSKFNLIFTIQTFT